VPGWLSRRQLLIQLSHPGAPVLLYIPYPFWSSSAMVVSPCFLHDWSWVPDSQKPWDNKDCPGTKSCGNLPCGDRRQMQWRLGWNCKAGKAAVHGWQAVGWGALTQGWGRPPMQGPGAAGLTGKACKLRNILTCNFLLNIGERDYLTNDYY